MAYGARRPEIVSLRATPDGADNQETTLSEIVMSGQHGAAMTRLEGAGDGVPAPGREAAY
jgi:hypothetical protein